MSKIVSVAELAELFDLTPRRVQQLVNEGVIPKPKTRGEYELTACVKGYINSLKQQIDGSGNSTLASERTRLAKAQADKTEMDNAVRSGELIEISEVTDTMSTLISASRAKILTLPVRLSAKLAGSKTEKEIKTILEAGVRETLTELSAWQPSAKGQPVEQESVKHVARNRRRHATVGTTT